MTIFVNASALVALCSALALWETTSALVRSYSVDVDSARTQVNRYVVAGRLRLVPIGEREYAIALDAYERYGKGRHPAGLNMGDCFAYACAKANGAALLYKGNDFSRTDLA